MYLEKANFIRLLTKIRRYSTRNNSEVIQEGKFVRSSLKINQLKCVFHV